MVRVDLTRLMLLDLAKRTVYDAKVSIRSKLHILQTIRSKLSWKVDCLVRNPSPNQPFIFDIDGRSLEFGREDFCLITGFRFGKVSLDPKKEDHSEFYYVFMGQELRRVITNAIVKLTKVRQEVHVRTEVRRFVDKEEVHTRVVEEEDVQERASMEGVIQCMNDDQVDKNCNDVPDNYHVNGLEYYLYVIFSERFNDEYDSIAVDGLISLKSQDIDHISKISFVMDDLGFKENDNEEGTYSDTFLSTQQKYPGKACVSPYVPPPSTEVKCKKRHRVMKLDKPNILIRTLIGPNGNEIPLFPWKEWTFPWLEDGHVIRMDFWEKLVGRIHTKRGWLSDDVYFPVNESDSHWVHEELDITSGVITFYDSLGGPPSGVETRH
nr:phospholipase-like protein [Tanacetum cinerariifolium]